MNIKNIAINLALLILFAGGIALGYYLAQPNTIFFTREDADSSDSLFIRQSFQFTFDVVPDMYSASPHIGASPKLLATETLLKEEQSSIIQSLNAITQKVKESGICDGGGYSLSPKKYWVKDVAKSGYDLLQDVQCKFKQDQKQAYETLLQEITQIVHANAFLTLSIPKITAFADMAKHNKALHKTHTDALEQIKSTVIPDYEKALQTKCTLLEFNFNENQAPRPYYAKANVMSSPSADMAVVLPAMGVEEHPVRIDFVVKCKQ